MKCNDCGFENPEKSKFCGKCGKALVQEKTYESQKETIKSSYKKSLPAVGVLGILLLAYWVIAPNISNISKPSDPASTPFPASTSGEASPTPLMTSKSSAAVTPRSDLKTFNNSIGMEFVKIPAGEFDMGLLSIDIDSDSKRPVHHVTISKDFYLGKYEVTQQQWLDVMGTGPSYFVGADLPVEWVSWDDVQQFIKKLNEKEGTNKYRLPSEAEWEYAVRAGTRTRYFFGDSNSSLGDYAWYAGNSDDKTHPVGQKNPNGWGLYDMHGNIAEWIQDTYHGSYTGAPTDGSSWEGSDSYPSHVIRGCSYNEDIRDCESASRFSSYGGASSIGFRLVRIL